MDHSKPRRRPAEEIEQVETALMASIGFFVGRYVALINARRLPAMWERAVSAS